MRPMVFLFAFLGLTCLSTVSWSCPNGVCPAPAAAVTPACHGPARIGVIRRVRHNVETRRATRHQRISARIEARTQARGCHGR